MNTWRLLHWLRLGLLAAYLVLAATMFAACQGIDSVPTRVPRAAASTLTATPLPTATSTPTRPAPTVTPSPSPVVAFRQPASETPAGINITTPSEGSRLPMGAEATAGGRVQLEAGQVLSVTLVTATGWVLAESRVDVSPVGTWQATIPVPESVSGAAAIQATIVNSDGAPAAVDSHSIQLIQDTEEVERYLSLFRPEIDGVAMAGYQLFFDGRVQFPVNNLLTISIWDSDCRQPLASQSYRLRGSGYWQGFVVAPRDLAGPACAVASTGTPGEPEWREAQVRLNVLPSSNEGGRAVLIGNPPPGSIVTRNETLLLYGTAWLAPENTLSISILLENGRVLNEGLAVVDGFGYWEVPLFIPGNALGPAEISAAIGSEADGNHAEHSIIVEIEP